MSGDAFSGNLETSNFKMFPASATKVRLPERGEEGRGRGSRNTKVGSKCPLSWIFGAVFCLRVRAPKGSDWTETFFGT